MSPTVFKWKGYRFFFFSREETRPHVHVYCSDGEGKFWLEPRVELARSHGLWLLIGDKEYFLPHDDFPWFRKATLDQILNVELLHENHLHWPAVDVDLSLDSLDHPESFPLIYK